MYSTAGFHTGTGRSAGLWPGPRFLSRRWPAPGRTRQRYSRTSRTSRRAISPGRRTFANIRPTGRAMARKGGVGDYQECHYQGGGYQYGQRGTSAGASPAPTLYGSTLCFGQGRGGACPRTGPWLPCVSSSPTSATRVPISSYATSSCPSQRLLPILNKISPCSNKCENCMELIRGFLLTR
jgi:hypothetical protein